MDNTIRRMAKILGASGVEASGHDASFEVASASGERLRVSLKGDSQRLMAVLQDPSNAVSIASGAPGTATVVGSSLPGIRPPWCRTK